MLIPRYISGENTICLPVSLISLSVVPIAIVDFISIKDFLSILRILLRFLHHNYRLLH